MENLDTLAMRDDASLQALFVSEALPPKGTSRWVVSRKAKVIEAIRDGFLTAAEACDRYDLSLEELASWRKLYLSEGASGLRAERVQHHRREAVKPSTGRK